MRMTTYLAIGFCGSLVLIPTLASDPGANAQDASDTEVASEQARASGGADSGNAVSGTSAAKGDSKPAGTGTAARYINKQVQEGNMKIEGMTTEDEVVLP